MPQPWVLPPQNGPSAELLAESGDPLLAQILALRGLTDPRRVRAFLNPLAYTTSHPEELPDLVQAAKRIDIAIHAHEPICVWGDFDVDGQTATTILVSTLRLLGANTRFHIPIRQTESHGIQLKALKDEISRLPFSILLTCDTGISAHESIAYAQSQGVDVIITDHHTVPASPPAALAIINPRLISSFHPLGQLCGAGTAFKLAEYLLSMHGLGCDFLYDLAALGTIADLVPLTGENRYLVQQGLLHLGATQRPGLQALYELAELKSSTLTEEHVTFLLAPRLNAVGRLADANIMVDFFLTGDMAQARNLAGQCEGLNARRKLLCDQVYDAAIEQIANNSNLMEAPVLVLNHPAWPAGILGIIASRLVERYQKPALLISSPPGETARGSARSIPGFNVTDLLTACSETLSSYGGHPMAAGFALSPENIPIFRARIIQVARQSPIAPPPIPCADALMPFSALSYAQVKQCERLAPFGPGNPPIMLIAENVHIVTSKTIGKNNEHLKLMVADENEQPFDVLWWNGRKDILPPDRFDLAYSPRTTTYQGADQLNFIWLKSHSPDALILTSQKVTVTDYRDQPLMISSLEPDIQIWYEGPRSQFFVGRNQHQLEGSSRLALAALPPGPDELRQVMKSSKATEVFIIFSPNPPENHPSFIKHLSGLIKYSINQRQGIVLLAELAAATAHRERTILLGIQWLALSGHIEIEDQIENGLTLALGSRQASPEIKRVEKELAALIEETNAYRQHLQSLSATEWGDLLTQIART